VKGLLERYPVPLSSLLVVYDELALPWQHIRIRQSGSAGGHRGMADVIACVGSQEFPRLRLGISPGRPVGDGAKFVLAPFGRAQWKELDELLDQAAEAVEFIIAEGVEKAMTKYNRRARGSMEEEG
jgi:PTH1 family peptidyl-tRNA hydrolase